jgi:hypothetical protein
MLDLDQQLRVLLEKLERPSEEVVKVQRIVLSKLVLVLPVNLSESFQGSSISSAQAN